MVDLEYKQNTNADKQKFINEFERGEKVTERESQIYQWIKENPMISQEELARKANIKRSSVAVHISNLMKKGYIQGKGYITNPTSYCMVIGGVNIDIGGRPDQTLIPKDSNPGHISMSLGGVGRNIAHNMSLLGLHVKMITALGDDANAHRIMENCKELGIDISHSCHSTEDATSTYLFIAEADGDMSVAISDMSIYRHMTPEFMESKMDIINRAGMVVIDTNIPEETISYLASNCKVPIYADPVSCTKAKKLVPVLGRIHTITPNLLEAQILTGMKIDSGEALKKASDVLLEMGIKQVFITLGADGIFAANKEEAYHFPNLSCKLVNATGAGDAMMAGFAYAQTEGYSLKQTAMTGLGAASIAVEGAATINEELCVEEVKRRAGLV